MGLKMSRELGKPSETSLVLLLIRLWYLKGNFFTFPFYLFF